MGKKGEGMLQTRGLGERKLDAKVRGILYYIWGNPRTCPWLHSAFMLSYFNHMIFIYLRYRTIVQYIFNINDIATKVME